MQQVALAGFTISCALLVYTYILYPLILLILPKHHTSEAAYDTSKPMSVDVILAAFNEEAHIANRLSELASHDSEYDFGVVVGNDGSADKTSALVRSHQNERTTLLDFEINRGRAETHNRCIEASTADVVIFSDVETEFSPGFVDRLMSGFTDPNVGCVVGTLLWANENESAEARSMGIYWRYEQWLRTQESQRNLLATGTGAAMAVRRDLYETLRSDEDVDFVTPLHVIRAGKSVIADPLALAVDVTPATTKGVWRARTRMTSKNFVGTLRVTRTMLAPRHLLVLWSLFSHKVLRWLSGFFVVGVGVTACVLAVESTPFRVIAALGTLGVAYAVAGGITKSAGLSGQVWSFLVALAAMSTGVLQAVLGRRVTAYSQSDT